MPRFYVEGCQDAQTGITIMGEDVNHIKNVLRLTIGDTITVCDGAGKEYECEIAEISKEQVYANIVDISDSAFDGLSELFYIEVHPDNPVYGSSNGELYRKP